MGSIPAGGAKKQTPFVPTGQKVFVLTKSVLTNGINSTAVGEIACVVKFDFVGIKDEFNFICEADLIRVLFGFHRTLHNFIKKTKIAHSHLNSPAFGYSLAKK